MVACYENRNAFTAQDIAAREWVVIAGFLSETSVFGGRTSAEHGPWVPDAAMKQFRALYFKAHPDADEKKWKSEVLAVRRHMLGVRRAQHAFSPSCPLQNISLYMRHGMTRKFRLLFEKWKTYFDSGGEAPSVQFPGPSPFRDGALLSVAEYFPLWLQW